jgi:hypothetical protein
MWVFDGEEWYEEGKGSAGSASSESRPRYEELMPELQVVEILPVVPTRMPDVPPLPLP